MTYNVNRTGALFTVTVDNGDPEHFNNYTIYYKFTGPGNIFTLQLFSIGDVKIYHIPFADLRIAGATPISKDDAYTRLSALFPDAGGAASTTLTRVDTYDDLPDAAEHEGEYYFVENSQGTSWLPGSLGGTYYKAGLYFSNGTTWKVDMVPFQATQGDVNAGSITNQFVSPNTLANASLNATNLLTGYVPDARLQYIIAVMGSSYANTNTVGASSTQYLSPIGSYSNFNNENVRTYRVPPGCNGVLRNMTVYLATTQPASGTLVCTLEKNGSATTLVISIAANAVSASYSDTTHTVTLAGGDRLTLKAVNGATGASGAISSFAMMVTNY